MMNIKGVNKMYRGLENEDLVLMYQTSEDKFEKEDILATLLNKNEGIITKISNNYANIPNLDEVDRESELTLEFVKAVEDFDFSKGYKLTTVIRAYLTRKMNRIYKEQTTQKRYDENIKHSSYEVLVDLHKDKDKPNGDTASIIKLDTFKEIEFWEMYKALDLTEREKMTCDLIMSGKNKSETARVIGVTPRMIKCYLDSVGKKMILANCV